MAQDDAGGGRRGSRAIPSAGLLQAVRDGFGLDVFDETDMGGSSNLNLAVRAGARRLVVRVYRPYVSETRLRDIHAARRVLAAGGVPVAEALPAKDGRPWLWHEGRLVEVEPWVAYDAKLDQWEGLEAGLPTLGRVHTLLRGLEVGPDGRWPAFANHLEARDALEQTLAGTRRMRGWGAAAELQLAEAAEALAQAVAHADEAGLPRQLVHGDFWDNNVFFRDGRVILVADFDFMGERLRIDDLALTLFFTCMKYPDTPPARLRSLVEAYNSGLDQPLSDAERAALPLALARQPLWSIGGWVALLDDEGAARRHAAGSGREVAWGLGVVRDLEEWRAALA